MWYLNKAALLGHMCCCLLQIHFLGMVRMWMKSLLLLKSLKVLFPLSWSTETHFFCYLATYFQGTKCQEMISCNSCISQLQFLGIQQQKQSQGLFLNSVSHRSKRNGGKGLHTAWSPTSTGKQMLLVHDHSKVISTSF